MLAKLNTIYFYRLAVLLLLLVYCSATVATADDGDAIGPEYEPNASACTEFKRQREETKKKIIQ